MSRESGQTRKSKGYAKAAKALISLQLVCFALLSGPLQSVRSEVRSSARLKHPEKSQMISLGRSTIEDGTDLSAKQPQQSNSRIFVNSTKLSGMDSRNTTEEFFKACPH